MVNTKLKCECDDTAKCRTVISTMSNYEFFQKPFLENRDMEKRYHQKKTLGHSRGSNPTPPACDAEAIVMSYQDFLFVSQEGSIFRTQPPIIVP